MQRENLFILCLVLIIVASCAGKLGYRRPDKHDQKLVEEKSGPPWEKDPEFIKAQQEHQTPVLVASYQAVLPDPILNERYNISLAADYLRGTVVNKGEVFSFNNCIGERSATRGFKQGPMYQNGQIIATIGGGVCKIASVLYNVAILANQEIVERHPHSMLVPYVPPGQDATISYGSKDFKFRNTSLSPLLIWSENQDDTLYIAFYGTEHPPHVAWTHKNLDETSTWTEFIEEPSLPKGTEKEVFEGYPGLTVHSWITVTQKTGEKEVKDLGIDTYQPAPRVVAVGVGAR